MMGNVSCPFILQLTWRIIYEKANSMVGFWEGLFYFVGSSCSRIEEHLF
jgi:hypothetical protein